MTRPAVLTPVAGADLEGAVEWISDDNPDAAQRLIEAVQGAARLIGHHPAIGARRPNVPPHFRFWPLRGFSYLIVYSDAITSPRILRIVHMSRDLPSVLAGVRE